MHTISTHQQTNRHDTLLMADYYRCSYLHTGAILTLFTVKMSMVWRRVAVDWLLVGKAWPSPVEFPVTNCCDFLVWPGEYADHLFEAKVLSGQCFGDANNPIFGLNEQVLLPCQPCSRIICRIILAGKVLISCLFVCITTDLQAILTVSVTV